MTTRVFNPITLEWFGRGHKTNQHLSPDAIRLVRSFGSKNGQIHLHVQLHNEAIRMERGRRQTSDV